VDAVLDELQHACAQKIGVQPSLVGHALRQSGSQFLSRREEVEHEETSVSGTSIVDGQMGELLVIQLSDLLSAPWCCHVPLTV
jgi:hypothetical protein